MTISAGPTVTTPRRAVGSVYTASVARPGPSGGMSRRSGRPPTCSSIVRDAIGVRRGFVTRTTATARSPTVTRSGSSVRSTSSGEPADHERQRDQQHDQAAGGDDHQLDPAEQPPADVGGDRRGRRRSSRSPSTGSVRRSTDGDLGALAHRRRQLDAVEDAVDEVGRSRPCPARPPASAACGGPSRPGRRCARRRG